MRNRGSRSGPMITISALVLAMWVVGLAVVGWRGLGLNRSKIRDRLSRIFTDRALRTGAAEAGFAGPLHLDDSRLASLRLAADSWKQMARPKRQVVDQVCLVPDVSAFLEAIALWDERHFFPILIDEPAWTLPFLRAFRPARVVRFAGRSRSQGQHDSARLPKPPSGSADVWPQALEAVAERGPDPIRPIRHCRERIDALMGSTPRRRAWFSPIPTPRCSRGLSLSLPVIFNRSCACNHPASPTPSPGNRCSPPRFGEVLSVTEALHFAASVEERVGSVFARYGKLGDDCDFLTIAGDWPYRYNIDRADRPIRGIYALDDLIGRGFDPTVRTGWLNQLRRRWAYAGRLLGDPAASAARAMGALFLQPESVLFWDTYSGGRPWSDYSMNHAAGLLSRSVQNPGAILHRIGQQADLASWHRSVVANNQFGMVFFNSSGGTDWFSIGGGPGRPSDVPRGWPASVATIHSYSAADPSNPQTIAGRWLANGAFTYFGSVNEPFLLAFRPPGLVAELVTAGIPLVAALRQGDSEAFGFPWRLVYLGDPLYRLEKKDVAQPRFSGRIAPNEWRKLALDYDDWLVSEITPPSQRTSQVEPSCEFESDNARLRWCLDAAVADPARLPTDRVAQPSAVMRAKQASQAFHADGWLKVLMAIHRDQLDQMLRPWFDDLLIDALEEVGALEELMKRLVQIPFAERGPRVWQAIEASAMHRLALLVDKPGTARGFLPVLDLWDQIMGMNWPDGSLFPAHLSERIGTLALQDVSWCRQWLDRLRRPRRPRPTARTGLDSQRSSPPNTRAKARVGGLGSSH